MPNAFDIGDVVRLSTEVRDTAGTLIAPSSIALRVRAPDGGLSSPAPDNDNVGLYHYDLLVDTDGLWSYRYTTSGTGAASDERSFWVNPRRVS